MAMEKVTFLVHGVTCFSCVARIEQALKKVDGVLAADVRLATERATVEYIAGVVALDDLKQAVAHAGYKVVQVPVQVGAEGEQKIDQEQLKLATARFPVLTSRWVTSEKGLNLGKILADLFVIGFCLFAWAALIVALVRLG